MEKPLFPFFVRGEKFQLQKIFKVTDKVADPKIKHDQTQGGADKKTHDH